MLIAKTGKPLRVQVAELLSIEELEAILEKKRRKANAAKLPQAGKKG